MARRGVLTIARAGAVEVPVSGKEWLSSPRAIRGELNVAFQNGKVCLVVISLLLWSAVPTRADDRIRFVHSFMGLAGGSSPNAVTGHQTSADSADWALYGTTYYGGVGAGVAYKLTPPKAGQQSWTETRLYVFQNQLDGENPNGPLLFDASGNAYGVSEQGGSSGGEATFGTVFQLAPPGPGQYFWTKTILHAFVAGPDGAFPYGTLIADASGALYGVARYRDSADPWRGTVFKLARSPTGQGAWTFTILHGFTTGGPGGQVGTTLTFDPAGALYGITDGDGLTQCPHFYRLTPPATGTAWSFTVLYSFSCRKLGYTSLLRGPAGDFYGSRVYPGSGEVFRLRPPAPGKTAWTETVLHTFGGQDGDYPTTLSRIDNSGSIYGATARRLVGASRASYGGIVFRLDPPADGLSPWAYAQIAVTSQRYQTDPNGLLVRDPAGALYTSMASGSPRADGSSTGGAVFRIAP